MSSTRKANPSAFRALLSLGSLGMTSLLAACGGATSEGALKEPTPTSSASASASVAPVGSTSAAASVAPVGSTATTSPGVALVAKLQTGMDKPVTLEGTTPAKREITTPCGFFTRAPSAMIEVPEGGLPSAGLFLAFERGGEGRRFLLAGEGFDPAAATLKDSKTHQCLPSLYVGRLPAGRQAVWVGSETQDVALPFKFIADAPSDPASASSLLLLASNVASDLPIEKRLLTLHYPRLTALLLESEVTTIQGQGRSKRALELRRQLWLTVPEALFVFARPDAAKAFSAWPQPLTASEPLLITKILPYLVRAMTADGRSLDFKSADLLTTTRPASLRIETKRTIEIGPDDPQNADYTSPQMQAELDALKQADKKYQTCFDATYKPDAINENSLSSSEVAKEGMGAAKSRAAAAKADKVCKTDKAAFEAARAPVLKGQMAARRARHAEVIAEIAARFAK